MNEAPRSQVTCAEMQLKLTQLSTNERLQAEIEMLNAKLAEQVELAKLRSMSEEFDLGEETF